MVQPFDSDKAAYYVFRYYGHLMTEHERRAYRHFAGVLKASYGRTDQAAQLDSNRVPFYLRSLLSDDPQVLALVRDGFESFILRTGQRILNQHPEQIFLNCCPRCGKIARTPTARQCRFCTHDWHS